MPPKLKPKDITYLKKIGLSRDAIQLYQAVLTSGPLSAKDASARTGKLAEAEYRLFYELESKRLVTRIEGWPRRFKALPLGDGLQASLLNEEKELEKMVSRLPNLNSASVVIGRQEVYRIYSRYARKAKKQICIYAIGIAYTNELAKAQAGAAKRGVSIRHVVQEVKSSNFFVIDRWLRLGVKMRILKRPRGYHLVIIDGGCAIVTFSNPKDTDQRVSLITTEPYVVSIFQSQFESIWKNARPIE